jgi:hypothetical protein
VVLEKDNRAVQMKDEKRRKRLEKKEERIYDKDLSSLIK